MRALVTGATGFLGHHLVARLGQSAEVHALQGDVRTAASYEALPSVDVIYHLAGLVSIPQSVADPATVWSVNVDGTFRLLDWARARAPQARIVLASSAHVYGRAECSPINETHPLRPVTPYGASKMAAEALGMSHHATYGLDIVTVRPFNIYGPRQARGSLIPDVLHQIHEGKELRLGDPRPIRDFTYVEDAAEFLWRSGTVPGIGGETFNLGSGTGHSVADVVALARKASGSYLEPIYDTSRFRSVDLLELVVDNRRARERLGWTPTVPLDKGLQKTWDALVSGKR
ncbi:MAG: GDP-mannose 4,6-dehydratase [Candidatus Thermoplasmatota archaeon]